jgi:hypothetical protein
MKNRIIRIASLLICVLLIFIFVFSFCSCKSTKTIVNDQSEIDSLKIQSNEQTQTFQQMQSEETSTTYQEGETLTTNNETIIFGEGGGTYNTKTGDATNVDKIERQTHSEDLNETIIIGNKQMQSESDQIINKADTTTAVKKSNDIKTNNETTYKNNWYIWLLIGAGGILVLIFAIKFFI